MGLRKRFIFDSCNEIRDLRLGRVQCAFALVLAFSFFLNGKVLRPRSLPLVSEGNQVVSGITAPWVNHSVLDGYLFFSSSRSRNKSNEPTLTLGFQCRWNPLQGKLSRTGLPIKLRFDKPI